MKFTANLHDMFAVVHYSTIDGLAIESVTEEMGGNEVLEVKLADGSVLRFVSADVEVCDATGTVVLKAIDDDDDTEPWVLTFLMARPICLMDVQAVLPN